MVHATPDAPGSWVRIRGQAKGPERKVAVAANSHRGRQRKATVVRSTPE
jgi:hypothetical protein